MESHPANARAATVCPNCGGRCEPQLITVTLRRSQATFVFVRNVPADVCQTCGEAQFTVRTTTHMMSAVHTDQPPDDVALIPIYDLAAVRS